LAALHLGHITCHLLALAAQAGQLGALGFDLVLQVQQAAAQRGIAFFELLDLVGLALGGDIGFLNSSIRSVAASLACLLASTFCRRSRMALRASSSSNNPAWLEKLIKTTVSPIRTGVNSFQKDSIDVL
jgi:hypothetical protein